MLRRIINSTRSEKMTKNPHQLLLHYLDNQSDTPLM